MSVKEYMSTKVNLGDNWDDWNRYNPLRQELERIRIEKFSETSWLRVYNTWKKQLEYGKKDTSWQLWTLISYVNWAKSRGII